MGPFTVCEVGFIDGIIRVGFCFDFNVSCNGCAGGGKQPHFLRFPLLIACFPKEGPVPPPVERKVFRFGPTEVFVWVSSSRPSPQTREDGCIDAAKGTLANHVPMIVGPAPNLGVCLGSAGNGEVAFSVRVDSAPFGAGIFKAFGVYRPMTFVLFGADGARVMSLRGHCKTDHFLFCLPVARFPRENLAPGSPKSDDCRLVCPGASPPFSVWATTEA